TDREFARMGLHQGAFDADDIARRRAILEDAWRANEKRQALEDLLKICNPDGYNRYTLAAYERLKRSIAEPAKVTPKDRFRGVSDKSCNAEEMKIASALAAEVGRYYNTWQLTVRFSRDTELMGSLQHLIQRNLNEANSALLARTASTLTKALRAGDADFILEKAGIRYHHVLMDEFQDTSRLQWSVIRQLLQDVLAGAGNTLLIVGDIKQSIYRWRNGDWHIMDGLAGERISGLAGERVNERFTSLTKNFRSSEEVVRFNLSLFDYIIRNENASERIYGEDYDPQHLERFYNAEKKRGGYVRFKAFPKGTKEELAQDMFDRMEEMLQAGASPSDMMVLVREKKEAAFITYLKTQLSPNMYPSLTQAAIVSADSFLLEASGDVQLLIAGLRVVAKDDPVAAQLIAQRTGDPAIITRIREQVTAKTPLYEAACEILRILLTDADGQYKGTETAYLNNLLDRIRAYVGAYGSHLDEFLTYWDDTMHAKSIPASATNAIRIMTVHASKGLQAQTLFVPFCTWTKEASKHPQKIWCEVADELHAGTDYVPIQDGTEMAESAYTAAYEEEHLNMRVDNLNMLYVALTRAEDNLFVSTLYPVNKDGNVGTCNHVGRYIMDFVGADDYEVGVPVIKKTDRFADRTQSTDLLSAELWANDAQVRFVQSQEGALYTDYGEEAYRRVARMDEGTLCHEIFAHLRKADELDAVLDTFESNGEIRDKAQREELKTLISAAWKGNDKMRDWFTAPWELRLEEAIYMDHKELRPDRVMINPQTKEAIVLDYKFGNWNEHYITQVSEYKQALRNLGYAPVSGYLWFAKEKRLVEVKK
ncbi:MAG: UvrD-helicase domain-containing protein, partial [Paludibacteraceae bacterium]|nr:UvrD-helicase domain-containing protein [Paludibacteraceae bacterium]